MFPNCLAASLIDGYVFIILPFPKIEAEYVEDDENFRQGDRGGGIGSTGV